MSSRVPSLGANDHLVEKIIRAPFFLHHCANADLLSIAEHAIDIDFIGGFFGGSEGKDRCSPFACLVFKMLFLIGKSGGGAGGNNSSSSVVTPSPALHAFSFLEEFVQQPHHKYLRVFGIVCLRLILGGSSAETNLMSSSSRSTSGGQLLLQVHKALDVGFLDYRRVRMMRSDGSITVTTVDQVCDMMMTFSMKNNDEIGSNNNQKKQHEFLGLSLGMLPSRRQILELFPEEKKNLMNAVEV